MEYLQGRRPFSPRALDQGVYGETGVLTAAVVELETPQRTLPWKSTREVVPETQSELRSVEYESLEPDTTSSNEM